MIRTLGRKQFPDYSTSVKTEVSIDRIGKVDVLGLIGEVVIAVECGNTNPKKIIALYDDPSIDLVLLIPFCYTQNFVKIDLDEITHKIVVGLIRRELEKRGLTKDLTTNK